MITVYGIKNCATMQKARTWLEGHGVAYEFHDYKTAGIDPERLERWCSAVGWEKLLNRSGTTFRKLAEAQKVGLNERSAVALMLAQPSMIKRPVMEADGQVIVGFEIERYQNVARHTAPARAHRN